MGVQYPVPAAPGPDGPTGAAGNSVRHGSGAPGAGLGVNGDFYIDITDPDALVIYGPKLAGAWGIGAALGGGGLPTGDVSWAPDALDIEASGAVEILMGSVDGGAIESAGVLNVTSFGTFLRLQAADRLVISDPNGGSALKIGVWGAAPVVRPAVPAIPLAQDIVDALKLIGWVTQSA